MQTPEYALLQKLWSAYQGKTPRSEVSSLLTKGYGEEIFNLRVGLDGWLGLLPEPEWIEHLPKGKARRHDQSELKARMRLPIGVFQVSFVFFHDPNTGEVKFHDLWMAAVAGDRRQFWILQDDEVIRKSREELDKIRVLAKAIAGETSSYDQLSKNLAEFRDLASRLNLLNKEETKKFLDHGESLGSLGAGWNQTITKATQETLKDNFSSEFVTKLRSQITETGGKLDAQMEVSLKKMVEQEVQARHGATIQKLSQAKRKNWIPLKRHSRAVMSYCSSYLAGKLV